MKKIVMKRREVFSEQIYFAFGTLSEQIYFEDNVQYYDKEGISYKGKCCMFL